MKAFPTTSPKQRGFTITELLVAAAISIIVVGAVVVVFRDIGKKITIGRARLELAGQMRSVNILLRDDLDRVTVPAVPWPETSGAHGYLEIGEQANTIAGDAAFYAPPGSDLHLAPDQSLGDCNDFIAMTVHNPKQAYRGRILGRLGPLNTSTGKYQLIPDGIYRNIESHTAEIIWFVSFSDNDGDGNWDGIGEPLKLVRRVFLVRPDIDASSIPFSPTDPPVHLNYDLSVHVNNVSGNLQTNNLADLAIRQLRAGRDFRLSGGTAAPAYPYDPVALGTLSFPIGFPRRGEDVVLSNLAAFDLRVYDPRAAVDGNGAIAMLPDDAGYSTGAGPVARGCFVNLGAGDGKFSGPPNSLSGMTLPTYDTWSTHYENDGVDQNGNGIIDEATNGVDDNLTSGQIGGVDDDTERETSPPYPFRLRGINARIRAVEFDRHQVLQTSVSHSFVPE
ncbi:MAG: prepilin-type N-terminal cleavage/methylation domain-containing protein [bacterium]|nr:prepilin-type N-terminal cleavage/methylation domain-containing protein [bacterium]